LIRADLVRPHLGKSGVAPRGGRPQPSPPPIQIAPPPPRPPRPRPREVLGADVVEEVDMPIIVSASRVRKSVKPFLPFGNLSLSQISKSSLSRRGERSQWARQRGRAAPERGSGRGTSAVRRSSAGHRRGGTASPRARRRSCGPPPTHSPPPTNPTILHIKILDWNKILS
jgi:hypothetical protein